MATPSVRLAGPAEITGLLDATGADLGVSAG
jgi:hypothetical protein